MPEETLHATIGLCLNINYNMKSGRIKFGFRPLNVRYKTEFTSLQKSHKKKLFIPKDEQLLLNYI